MASDAKGKIGALGFFIIVAIAVIAIIYIIWEGYLDELIGGALLLIIAVAVIYIVLHFILGVFFFLEAPDTVHEDSPATLDDIQPFEGSMNNDDQKSS